MQFRGDIRNKIMDRGRGMLLCGEEVDRRLNWPAGKAQKLARRGKLPHVVLPDGAIRFIWEQVERLLRYHAGDSSADRREVSP